MSCLKIKIVDSTLCEGELAAGVSFTVDQKVEVARELDRIGVDVIEVGRPAISDEDFEAVREVAGEGLQAEVAARAWLSAEEVEAAIECNIDRVMLATSAWKEASNRLGLSWEKELKEGIKAALERGVKVTLLIEWASQTALQDLLVLCEQAVSEGADTLCLVDTSSLLGPNEVRSLFEEVKKKVGAKLEAKCYNAMGLAVANAIAALSGGAEGVHVAVNGIGEGPGITSMAEVAVALKTLAKIETVRLNGLPRLSMLVEKYSGIPLPTHSPVVGDYSFTVKTGPRMDLALEGLNVLWPIKPEEAGRKVEIEVSKYCSVKAIGNKLEKLGLKLDNEQVNVVLKALRSRPALRLHGDMDLASFVEEVLGIKPSVEVPKRIEASVMVQCTSNIHTASVAKRILSIEGVEEVFELSGEFDIEVRLSASSIVELNERLDRIRAIKGVAGTRTRLILKRY
ncbi:MAG: hypothetical protein DRN06_03355 [Thermoprotei archaeon]|nr:MAG: hypothetical protein DRN06_03355 [Thermoprotei archaeon]